MGHLLRIVGLAIAGGLMSSWPWHVVGAAVGALVGWQWGEVSRGRERTRELERGLAEMGSRVVTQGAMLHALVAKQASRDAAAAPVAPARPAPAPAEDEAAAREAARDAALRESAANDADAAAPTSVPPPLPAAPRPVAEPAARVGAELTLEPVDPVREALAREPAAAAPPPPRPAAPGPAAGDWREAAPRPQRPPPRAPAPEEDDVVTRALKTVVGWFTEGNVPVKVGIVVLFVGIAATLKWFADAGLFNVPIGVRFAGVAAAALAALAFGWRERERRPAFGLALQGGALGVLLLVLFVGYRMYALFPASLALAGVVAVVALATVLALRQDAMVLAVLGFLGGYLGPVLVNTGSGDHVALFSYFAVLNAAVFAIAWFRHWRLLDLVGFFATFAIGSAWGVLDYVPAKFATTEPFLVGFFAFYALIPLLHALRGTGSGRVDGTLVFGLPLLAFPLQAALLQGDDNALALSAIAVAAIYASFALLLHRRDLAPVLKGSYAALAVGFATLAVPLASSAQWTAPAWALEGVALVWLGLRQQRRLPRWTGYLLQAMAAVAWVVAGLDDGWQLRTGDGLLPPLTLAALVLLGSALAIAWLADREAKRGIARIAMLLAVAWWQVLHLRLMLVADLELPRDQALAPLAWSVVAGLLLPVLAARALRWERLLWLVAPAFGWLLVLVAAHYDGRLFGLGPLGDGRHGAPLTWLAIALALAGLLRLQAGLGSPTWQGLLRPLAWLVAIAYPAWLFGAELLQQSLVASMGNGWWVAAALAPAGALWWACLRGGAIPAMLDEAGFRRIRPVVGLLGALALGLGLLVTLPLAGDADPFVFLPLLNPLEVTQLAIVAGLAWAAARAGMDVANLRALLAIAGFGLGSLAVLRGVHHLAGLPWSPSLLSEGVAQSALTVAWSLAGVAAWILGSRQGRRTLWNAGAALMGVVLLKLLLVDRGHMGNLPGIVSFMAVGLLLVGVGYIAPQPPKARAD